MLLCNTLWYRGPLGSRKKTHLFHLCIFFQNITDLTFVSLQRSRDLICVEISFLKHPRRRYQLPWKNSFGVRSIEMEGLPFKAKPLRFGRQPEQQWSVGAVSHFCFILGCLIFPDLKFSSLVVSAGRQRQRRAQRAARSYAFMTYPLVLCSVFFFFVGTIRKAIFIGLQ